MTYMKTKILSMLVLLMTAATGAWADWTGGTYTVTANENIGSVNVSSDATLTINEGVTLTVNSGITVADGKTLTIEGPGTLNVTGTSGANGADAPVDDAGNGGDGGAAISGTVVIYSGTVLAFGGNGGNGGSSDNGNGGNGGKGGYGFSGSVTINGGNVTAEGGKGGNGGNGAGGYNGSAGAAGKAFASAPTINTPKYTMTDGTNAITLANILNYQKVVINYVDPSVVDVKINEAKTEATFEMPNFNTAVSYELVRDLTVSVDLNLLIDNEPVNRVRIAKNEKGEYEFVCKEGWQFAAIDKLDPENPVSLTNGELTYSLKKKEGDEYEGKQGYEPGTWRLEATPNEGQPYDGTIYSQDIELYEGYEVEIAAGEYATFYKDEALKVEDENAKLYTISSVGQETVTATELTVAPANTPLLVKNSAAETKTILLIPTTDKADEITAAKEFVGTLTATSIAASTEAQTNYAFNGKQFVWVKNAIAIAANKAWLQIGEEMGARSLTIVFGDNATSVNEELRMKNEESGDWYDLSGRKLQGKPSRKGLYILNGKKVVVK